MTVVVGGSSPQITFADSTVQNTAALPLTGGSVSADITVHGLTVGLGGGSVASNTALGVNALINSTNSSYGVTGFGYSALNSNTSGNSIVAVGANALLSNTTGSSSVAVGHEALKLNTTASNNTAVGYQAGYTNQDGANNVFVGYQAGYTATTSGGHTMLGYQAGYSANSSSSANTFVGNNAGYYVTSGLKNTIIGRYTGNAGGLDIRTSNNYIVLSDGDGNPAFYYRSDGLTVVGRGANSNDGAIQLLGLASTNCGPVFYGNTGTPSSNTSQWLAGSNSVIKGGTTYNTFTVQAGASGGVNLAATGTSWTSASDERLKDIIEPITNAVTKVSSLRAVIGKYKTDAEGTRRSFLIAQDVQAVLPEAISESRNSKDDDTEYLQLAYTEVIPLLVAAIKELKAEFDAYKATHP